MSKKGFEFECENIIYVNGVRMTAAELRKQKNAAKKAEKKAKREKVLLELSEHCKKIVKEFKLPKSLAAYYDNGYRQWGRIATTIINNPKISSPFVDVRCRVLDIDKKLEEINKLGKKSDKGIFGYIEKLGYLTDDLQTSVQRLSDGICESGILRQYKDHECVNGRGRRLGLQVLVSRTCDAVCKMKCACDKFDEIAKNGLDVTAYDANAKRIDK